MKRQVYLYFVVALMACAGRAIRLVNHIGQWTKRLGNRLIKVGGESQMLSYEQLLKCYLVDAELYIGADIIRGPAYVLTRGILGGDGLILKLNWHARRTHFTTQWKFGGACDFVLANVRTPHRLSNGDMWFWFDGGYAILFLGEPTEKLQFRGDPNTLRVYGYF